MNRQVILIAIAVLVTIIIVPNSQVLVDARNERESIEAAASSLNQAFTNVLAAENAGGNVTQLLARLNGAGELLAEADNAYRSGNLSNVTSTAEDARSIADQANSDAISLLNSSRSQNSLVLNLVFSVSGAIVFTAVLLLVWRHVKHDYMKKLLSSKPEVVENTA